MPLTLFHGPARAGKTDTLLKQVAEHLHSPFNQDFYLILPHQESIERTQKQLIELTQQKKGLFFGNTLLTFDRFLLQILKKNLPRVHRAPASLCRNILRSLLIKNNDKIFEHFKNYPSIVSELASTFIALKKNGLTPQSAESFFQDYITPELKSLIQIFSDYQNRLRDIDYYDDGDLVITTLKLLKEGILEFPQEVTSIYWDRIFPLTLGEREIIKELNRQFPDLNLVVSYSFDYQEKEDQYFYPAYSFLGEITHKGEYFHKTFIGAEVAHKIFSNPASEVDWVADHIRDLSQQGVPAEKIGVIYPPSPFYHQRLSEKLKQLGLPCKNPFCYLVTSFIDPKPDQLDLLLNLYLKEGKEEVKNTLTALYFKKEFEKQWEFEKHLAFNDEKDLEYINQSYQEELKQIKIEVPRDSSGISLLPLNQASSLNFDFLFVVGFVDTLYPSPNDESPFFTPEMLLQPETREILEGPTYRLSKEKFQLLHAINRAQKKVVMTRPTILWDGREKSSSRLLDGILEVKDQSPDYSTGMINRAPISGDRPPATETLSHFPKSRQSQFSTTELDTYLRCPYQYYARYQLKLGDRPQEEIEIPPDVRGSFVHRVLDTLYKNYLDLYDQAIEYDLYLNQFLDKCKEIIRKEKEKDSFLQHTYPLFQEDFSWRVYQVLQKMITREIFSIREQKKQTRPRYFEWAFGKGNIPYLKISSPTQNIFVSGRIDRIDCDEKTKTFTVIDYKTGQLESGQSLKNAASLQLPLYLLAVKNLLLKNFEVVGGYFIGLKDLNKKSGLLIEGYPESELLGRAYQITKEEWQSLQVEVAKQVDEIVDKIHQGKFEPNPREDSLCRFCDYREICHYDKNL